MDCDPVLPRDFLHLPEYACHRLDGLVRLNLFKELAGICHNPFGCWYVGLAALARIGLW